MTKQAIMENKKINDVMKNFKVVPYTEVSAKLNEVTKKPWNLQQERLKRMCKKIYVFAGPNGSGKSTVIQNFLESGICPDYYICPDNLVQQDKKDDKEAYLKAMQDAENLRNTLVELGTSFTFETVLSTSTLLNLLLA